MKFSILNLLKKNHLLLILIFIATLFYFIIFLKLGSFEFVKKSLFFTGDSLEYKGYADWLLGKGNYDYPFRTFFYPFLIIISDHLFGFYGIWIFQFMLWLTGCILVYKTMLRLTDRKDFAIFSFAIATLNVSLIIYTAHALTETTTFFFLTLFIYLFALAYKDYKKTRIFLGILFVISVLTVIRPVFQLFWYLTIIIILVIQYKSIILKPKLILMIILVSSPVIIQKTINKIKQNTFSCTRIADHNLQCYFYRKIKYFVDNKADPQVNQSFNQLPDSIHKNLTTKISKVEKAEILKYLWDHPIETIKVYWHNIQYNMSSGNPYVNFKNNFLLKWVLRIYHNFIFFYFHLLMTLIWIYYLIKYFRKNNKESHFIFICGILTFYILYSSGIAYWAGDRLVIYAIAIWSVFYPFIIYKLYLNKHKTLDN